MRIIAGSLKGRTLDSPTWDGLRPTSDRLRETLFNVLGQTLDGARVLDVCTGTGAVAIEALSRGATSVTCLDHACALVRTNATRCGVENRCMIVRGEAPASITAARLGGPFDVIVLDPPYAAPWVDQAVVAAAVLLAPGGRLVLEHGAKHAAPDVPGLTLERTRRQGDSALTTYRVAAEGSAEQ
jgi:16S rRNA (guanine(966)-N(2))-methyltransferase RsmD